MEQKYCQSCGMPMSAKEDFGTEKSGDASPDYCTYCYKDGKFTSDCTMDEMIEHCARFVDQFNEDSDTKYTKEEAIAEMKRFFPQLERWKNA